MLLSYCYSGRSLLMENMEIEKKYLIRSLPGDLDAYAKHRIEQGYLNTSPVIRVRRSDDEYYLTYKGSGVLSHEEYNLPLTGEAYAHLIEKADGNIISKTRYLIPLDKGLTAELDIFDAPFAPLRFVEVEFDSEEDAASFVPPEWFGEEVTFDKNYSNSYLSSKKF